MRISILTVVCCFVFICFAQEPPGLSFDENGKYILYEIVVSPTVPKDSLTNRANFFFKSFRKNVKLKASESDSIFNAEGKFVISKGASVLSHPSGEMVFDFVAEMKEAKYRYWLTNFKFVPYQRDRYGNFMPASTVYVPLENKPEKLNAEERKENIALTTKQAFTLSETFKKFLAGEFATNPSETSPKTISKQKW